MFFVKKSPVMPQINFLINSKDENRKNNLKRMNVLFILLHLILSLDFGFVRCHAFKRRVALKLFTLLQCFLVSLTCITHFFMYMSFSMALWYSVFCLEYLSYVIVLVLSNSEKTFHVLQNDLNSLDSVIGVNSDSYHLDNSMIIACVIIVILRTALSFGLCSTYEDSCIAIPFVQVIYFVPLFCNDIVLVVYFFTFYSIYLRLKKYTEFVKKSTSVVYCHYIYKTIVDFTEKVKDTFDAVFLVSIMFNTPELMASVFFTIKNMTSDSKDVTTTSFTTTQSLIVIFSPAFSAGLLAAQVQKIKLVLHDKLLEERDRQQTKDAKKFISYIEARPLRFTVCKVIPLDWNLPFIVLNLCITYLIVIIQFTHLY